MGGCSDVRGELGVPDQGETNACSGHVCAALCAAGGVSGADADAIYLQALDGRPDDGVPLADALDSVATRGVPLTSGTTAQAPRFARVPDAPPLIKRVLDSGRPVGAVLALTPRVQGFLATPEHDHYVLRDAGRQPNRSDAGHAVLLTGHSDAVGGGAFAARSSWGAQWGWDGHFWLPYSQLPLLEQLHTVSRGTGWT